MALVSWAELWARLQAQARTEATPRGQGWAGAYRGAARVRELNALAGTRTKETGGGGPPASRDRARDRGRARCVGTQPQTLQA